MKPKSEIYLYVRNPIDNKVICLRFVVVDNNVQPILSCRAMMDFGIITVHYENFNSNLCYQVIDPEQKNLNEELFTKSKI